jgi:malonyl CoA-acyl carrier protein transacylase
MVVVASPSPRPAEAAAAAGWDSRAVVLRGDDRAGLIERVRSLAAEIERDPSTDLAHRAGSLAAELAPGGARLGVVATSTGDLLAKLRRAAGRLADPNCRQIRDAAGVYFFEEPLYLRGSLALLFPGEGAQYIDMLADLCGVFPEVEETFAWCDRLAAESGRPSLRDVLHPVPENRAAAEAELRRLGPSIFGVLVADLAITKVLQNLRLPVAAVAGHSAGELAALLAAGAMNSEAVLGPRLAEIMDLMQRQEDEAGGPDVALLAVGAGKAAVDGAAVAVAGGAVVVAMDNCPHQCVAVGPTHLVAAVESALLARGLVCERLPFRRPYHTPLFEPWMGPFLELFADVPFGPPHTPVYCCSTGARFPDDPDAIRSLAVNHWVNPVEFARMIEAMHADGVRLFVEAGPRGNLSAFVEDILRGRPFAAVPANVPRKSGPTQINHLVAQLAAHHVPMDLGRLFAPPTGRTPTVREGVELSIPSEIRTNSSPAGHAEAHPLPDGRGSPAAVLDGYLATMEQFLDVQREVMEAFLNGRGGNGTGWLDLSAFPDLAALADFSPPTPPAATPKPFALVGRVDEFEPGRSIVFRRVMDGSEDLYADDHTLGGRGVSRVDPGQNGLPVLPMTFSLEAMAEAAALLVPGKVVVAVRDVRLYRWLPFDPEPTTLEVRAAVARTDPGSGVVEVKADVRDLGNSFAPDGAGKAASEAVVVLADRYPEPPAPLAFDLTDETLCKSTVEDLRRNMFHGPLFQMIRSLGRIGREGIEGTLEVQPRDRWFRSDPDPTVVLDPVLIDAAMHMLGAWHLEQPDWTGRILLPYEVKRVEFYGPAPPVGSFLVVRGHNEQESARHYRHGVEVFAPDGRPWMRMTGAGYWRFYLPFGHVNFFGPKDEYFLSRDWPEAVAGIAECGARNAESKAAPGEKAGGAGASASHSALRVPHSAFPRCHYLEPPVDLKQPVLRAAGARVTMTPRELAEFGAWKGADADLNDWFFGRMLAKDAVRAAWNEKHGEAMFPADIETEEVGGRIVCRPRGEPRAEPFPPVSVAIAEGVVAAFSAFAEAVGIALVPVGKDESEADIRARAARLAVADALRVSADGLTVTPGSRNGLFLVDQAGRTVRVQTARHKNVVVATAACEARQ